MNRWVWSDLYWGGVWLVLGFLIPELLGFYRIAPWATLSETVWHNTRYPLVGPLLFATLVFLCIHFLYDRPIWQAILYGLVVAGGAHLLDHRL